MPIIWSHKIDDNGELAVWHITESADELYSKLQLNKQERKYYESLQQGKRNLHWLGSRVLLRTLLNTSLYIDCQLDENNKPYLVNFPYEISITHSNDYAAVIIYKGKKVGIDIEKMSEKVERIAKRFLSEDELAFIQLEFRIQQLYVCWGVKESLFKLYGKGNLPFIGGIQIKSFEPGIRGSLNASIFKDDYQQDFQLQYQQISEYMLTWCVE
jgi:phosphopantetheinyl transferase